VASVLPIGSNPAETSFELRGRARRRVYEKALVLWIIHVR
jgi:hypothetical protein